MLQKQIKMTAKELCRCTIISFLFLDILVIILFFLFFSVFYDTGSQMSDNVSLFIYVWGNKKLMRSSVCVGFTVGWLGESFLGISSSITINNFFPLGLFSFPRGKFSSVLPVGSMPGYQVSGNLKNSNNFENIVLSCIGSGWVSALLIVWLIIC